MKKGPRPLGRPWTSADDEELLAALDRPLGSQADIDREFNGFVGSCPMIAPIWETVMPEFLQEALRKYLVDTRYLDEEAPTKGALSFPEPFLGVLRQFDRPAQLATSSFWTIPRLGTFRTWAFVQAEIPFIAVERTWFRARPRRCGWRP
jgi:hypothetical protein